MVLALALPTDFPHRDQLVAMTFGVVLLSLVLQGMSMSWLLRRLGLVNERPDSSLLEYARGELRAVDAALHELTEMRRQHVAHPEVLDVMERRVEARRDAAHARLHELHRASDELRRDEAVRAVRRLLVLERTELVEAESEGSMTDEVAVAMRADVDARLARLESGEYDAPEELLAPTPRGERRGKG
jgi:CPA1 family monovalent cation:H+ antiporter